MPKTSWKELNNLIHEVKNEIVKISEIEVLCKKLRDNLSESLDNLNNIVLKQVGEND